MKILLTADLHMDLKQFEWLEQQASRFDLIVIGGDLLQLGHSSNKEEQISQVLPFLKRIKAQCPILISSGNHDSDRRNQAGEECADWIQEFASEFEVPSNFANNRYRFTSCPWWNGPQSREAMLDQLNSEQPEDGVTWIWIHHSPPRGSRTAWTLKGDVGDPFLLKLIGQYRPAYVLSGHVHNAPFYAEGGWSEKVGNTWVFNAGKQPGKVPAHIELDLGKKSARYSSIEGIEILDTSS